MDGLEFITATPPGRANPARADIACFVGLVARRQVKPLTPQEVQAGNYLAALEERLPYWLFTWLREFEWLPPVGHCTREQYEPLAQLEDVPVPINTWEDFDQLFAWEAREIDGSGRRADTLLGSAVRSFFRQGGRTCFVVRVGNPLPVFARRADRLPLRLRLLAEIPPTPVDRETWRGVGHLFGLPEVSFLCLPDLPDLFAVDSQPLRAPPAPTGEEKFIECAEQTDPPEVRPLRDISAPRCDAVGFSEWRSFVVKVGGLLKERAREVQLLAALPLPVDAAGLAGMTGLSDLKLAERQQRIRQRVKEARDAQWREAAGIQTAFVQLAYPWLRSRDSATLPGDLEPPDATLAGMIADLALTRGAWRTVARAPVPWLQNVEPVLSREDLDRPLPFDLETPPLSVRQRISIFGPTSAGFRLLSDVTTDDDEHWRPASADRLLNLIVRAARLAGEEFVFFNNGEPLWNRLRNSLTNVLTALWADGAFQGATPADAFDVQCGFPTTMTQADLDAGRVIIRVEFTAAAPIDRIVVVLAMSDAGQVSIVSAQPGHAGLGKETP